MNLTNDFQIHGSRNLVERQIIHRKVMKKKTPSLGFLMYKMNDLRRSIGMSNHPCLVTMTRKRKSFFLSCNDASWVELVDMASWVISLLSFFFKSISLPHIVQTCSHMYISLQKSLVRVTHISRGNMEEKNKRDMEDGHQCWSLIAQKFLRRKPFDETPRL